MQTLVQSQARPGWTFGLTFLRHRPYDLLALVVCVAWAPPFLLKQHTEWNDVYLAAANDMAAGRALYPSTYGYVYPPFAAWIAIPATYLPVFLAHLLWYAISIVSLFLLFRWAWLLSGGGLLRGDGGPDRREHLVAASAVVLGGFALNTLSHTQTDLLIAALMMGGCLALTRARSLAAGICCGLAAALKGPALLWCPYLLWRRQWRAAAVTALVAVGVNLAPNLACAPPTGQLWLGQWVQSTVLPLQGNDYAPGIWASDMLVNQSLSGAIGRWGISDLTWRDGGPVLVKSATAISGAVLKGICYASMAALVLATLIMQGWRPPPFTRTAGKPSPVVLEFAMVLMLMLLLSPMSSKAHFCTLIVPGFCIARLLLTRPSVVLALSLGGTLLAIVISMRIFDPWAAIATWNGSLSWACLFLLLGCGFALRMDRALPVSHREGVSEPRQVTFGESRCA
jgi:hypothetical protein